MSHYTNSELELYRSLSMGFFRRIVCACHLKKCGQCAKLLEELSSDDAFASELSDSVHEYTRFSSQLSEYDRRHKAGRRHHGNPTPPSPSQA